MRVAFVGWRGMVGSVLRQRLTEEANWGLAEWTFCSTSNAGGDPPRDGSPPLLDAMDLAALATHDVVLSCQGGGYTSAVHGPLRAMGWTGHWVDAASTLRHASSAALVLDPVNGAIVEQALAEGCRDLIGANCTVSLLLMGVGAWIQQGWVEWISTMTYQAASGAGARQMTELVQQWQALSSVPALRDPAADALSLERQVTAAMREQGLPTSHLGAPLAGSLLPWIDRAMPDGSSREEAKGMAEAHKLLGRDTALPIDGVCVRVGALRCHSQGLTVKLRRDVPLADLEAAVAQAHPWSQVVPNTPEATTAELTPASVTGRLTVPVGRVRKLKMGPTYVGAFTVGDQLLWGAAEPLRRVVVRLATGHWGL